MKKIKFNKRIKIAAIFVLSITAVTVWFYANKETGGASTFLGAPGVVAANFKDGALSEDISTESCALSNGDKTTCYRIKVTGSPVDSKIGPFCPHTTSTSAEDSGIWLDGSKIYDADGKFILDLSTIYGNAKWKLYDDTGKVVVTDTKEAFQGAARPDVLDEYKYHCVEGTWEWTETGKPVTTSILVPVNPVKAESVELDTHGNLGVTLNGLVISESAPVDAILGAYTIAAFDDCGGHFNPVAGYHLHAFTNCEGVNYESSIADPNAETFIIGYAMDGVAVFAPLSSKTTIKLDECNGRTTEKDGYHYYAQSPEKNKVVKCMMGVTAIDSSAQGMQRPPQGPSLGLPAGTINPSNAKWIIGGLILIILALTTGVVFLVRNIRRKNKVINR